MSWQRVRCWQLSNPSTTLNGNYYFIILKMKMKKPAPNHLGCRIRIWTHVNEAMSPLTSYGLNNNRCLLQRKMPFQNTLIKKLSRKRTEKRPLMNPDNTVALGVRRKRLKRIKEWMSEWGETSLKYLLVKRKEGENFVHTLKDKQSKRRVTIFVFLSIVQTIW